MWRDAADPDGSVAGHFDASARLFSLGSRRVRVKVPPDGSYTRISADLSLADFHSAHHAHEVVESADEVEFARLHELHCEGAARPHDT